MIDFDKVKQGYTAQDKIYECKLIIRALKNYEKTLLELEYDDNDKGSRIDLRFTVILIDSYTRYLNLLK